MIVFAAASYNAFVSEHRYFNAVQKGLIVKATTRETLKLFVGKAALMRGRSFWRFFEEGGEIAFSFGINPTTESLRDVTFLGQDEEARDALLITLRFFLQNNERISLSNMASLSASDAGLSQAWTVGFAELHWEINQLLDDPAEGLGQEIGMPGLTRRQVLDICLYGEIAHAKPLKQAQYREWRKLPTFPLIEFTFAATVSSLLCTVFNAVELAEVELVQDARDQNNLALIGGQLS